MIKISLLIVLSFFLRADAGWFVYESFDYEGSTFIGEEGGRGWSGDWYKSNSHGERITSGNVDQVGGLENESLLNGACRLDPKGGRATSDLDQIHAARQFETPLSLDDDATYYFSFIMASGHNLTGNDIQFLGVDTLFAGFRGSGNDALQARVVGGSGAQAKSRPLYEVGTPYFFVGRILASADGNDTVSMSVYGDGDAVPLTEPLGWDLTTAGRELSGAISGIMLRHNGGNESGSVADGKPSEYDNFRMGLTYESVTAESADLDPDDFASSDSSGTVPGAVPDRIEQTPDDPMPGKSYTYKVSNGEPQTLEVYFPADWDPDNKVPGILLFHGGGWSGGGLKQFRAACMYFASRGLVAATADYRMHRDRDVVLPEGESRKQVCVTDAKSAIRWMKQHADELGIDPQRLIAGGGSAGGHISVLATTNPELNDPSDPEGFDTSVVAYLLFNPAFEAADSEYPQIDALQHVSSDFLPAVVFFGTRDANWLPGWEDVYQRLQELGNNDIDVWIAEGQKHGFFSMQPWRDITLSEADRFLAAQGFLGGECTLAVPKDIVLIKEEQP